MSRHRTPEQHRFMKLPVSHVRLAALCTLTLYLFLGPLNFASNAMPLIYANYPTYQNNGKQHFDENSERLVTGRIAFATRGEPYPHALQLWRQGTDATPPSTIADAEPGQTSLASGGSVYRSQPGLQGLLWATVARCSGATEGSYGYLRQLNALLTALMLAGVIVWMRFRWGDAAAAAALLWGCLATGINIFSNSLYWSVWLMLLPMAVSCWFAMAHRSRPVLLFIALTTAFLLKCLAGYEFISVVGLSALLPWFAAAVVDRDRTAWSSVVATCLALPVAFALSLVIYAQLFAADFGSSAIAYLTSRGGAWSVEQLTDVAINPLDQVAKIGLLHAADFNGIGVPLVAVALAQAAYLMALRRDIDRAAWLLYGYALAASASWAVLQPGHVLFHPRYVLWLVSVPCGLVFSALNVVVWQRRRDRHLRRTALAPSRGDHHHQPTPSTDPG